MVLLGVVLVITGIVLAVQKSKAAWWLIGSGTLLLLGFGGAIVWTLIVLMCTGRNGESIC
jgi:hypothetical protein